MPQVVEVLKYVHEIYEDDGLGVALTGDLQVAELRYRELYGNAKKQLELLLVELRQLKISQPGLRGIIEIIERFLLEFDRLAAAQRVVAVDREKVVEKEVSKGVLVPVNNIRNELAMSLLVEKLIIEIKRLKKENPNIRLGLDEEIGLIFFTELFDKANVGLSGDFQSNLKKYVETAIARFTKNGGKWTTDHELMLHTVLGERFAMASAIKYANEEIEKAKALAEIKGAALRERDAQFQSLTQTVQQLQKSLVELQNSGAISGNSLVSRNIDLLGNLITSNFTIHIGEPTRILGEFEGSGNDFNRLLSFLRERDSEVELLRTRLIDTEKRHIHTEFSGVDAERTIAALRRENETLVKTIDGYKSSATTATGSASGRERELELKLKTANSRIQELESQLRSAELQLKSFSSASTSRVDNSQVSQGNLVSSQYSTNSNSQQSATYGTSAGGVAGTTNTLSTYQAGYQSSSQSGTGQSSYQSGTGQSSYQTSQTRTSGTGATTTGTTYGTYGSGSGAGLSGSGAGLSGSGAGYGTTLSGSRTGATGTTTTTSGTTGATTYGSGSRTGTTTTTSGTGVSGSGTGSSSTTSYGQSGQRTSGTTGATGYGTSTGASYGTSGSVTSSQQSGSYGQSGSSSVSSSQGAYGAGSGAAYGSSSGTGASGYSSSSYNRTSGTGATGTGATGTSGSGLSSSGAGSASGSSSNYTFQTKRY